MELIVTLIAIVVSLLITYFVVRAAVTSALRQARHEDRVEKYMPNAATWLGEWERFALEKERETTTRAS